MGLLCFFDGLANSMVVGRVGRDLADRNGVARVKLAYIADSTSSVVACVAVISTWIAFQLSMISEAYALTGREANPYSVFVASLPFNFYCWFTLVFLTGAAVFSGAVFGDHCSPFSDTTIVTSISCGVEPHDHVRTQIPYALITAGAAILLGFLPAGLGWAAPISLGMGTALLLLLPRLFGRAT